MDRTEPSRAEHSAAVRAAGAEPIELVPRTGEGVGGEPVLDASDRRAVPADAVLRLAEHDVLADAARLRGQSQAGAALDADHGAGSDLSAAEHDPAKLEHRIYPYLLRDVAILRPNQVWSTDITYIPLARGYGYLTAVLDWYSRYVLSWELSRTLDGEFCLAALEQALAVGSPEIFNTDQGSQFTSQAFTGRLERAGVAISMDGRGRALDNVFVERLWRSVKYEDVYLKEYPSWESLTAGLGSYFTFYCHERPHQSLGNRTPAAVYHGS
jgi:transposase InsO family protein